MNDDKIVSVKLNADHAKEFGKPSIKVGKLEKGDDIILCMKDPNRNQLIFGQLQDYEVEYNGTRILYRFETHAGYSGGPIFRKKGNGYMELIGLHQGVTNINKDGKDTSVGVGLLMNKSLY